MNKFLTFYPCVKFAFVRNLGLRKLPVGPVLKSKASESDSYLIYDNDKPTDYDVLNYGSHISIS